MNAVGGSPGARGRVQGAALVSGGCEKRGAPAAAWEVGVPVYIVFYYLWVGGVKRCSCWGSASGRATVDPWTWSRLNLAS